MNGHDSFKCSICGEPSTSICNYCTLDACGNHLCDRCGRCSDCCTCDMHVHSSEPLNHTVPHPVMSLAHNGATPTMHNEPEA